MLVLAVQSAAGTVASPDLRATTLAMLDAYLDGGGHRHVLIPEPGMGPLTVLQYVAQHGWADAVTTILKKSPTRQQDAANALECAAYGGSVRVISELLAAGAGADTPAKGNALRHASQQGHVAVTAAILNAGVSDDQKADALSAALSFAQHETAALLMEWGADPVVVLHNWKTRPYPDRVRDAVLTNIHATLNAVAAAIPSPQRSALLRHHAGDLPAVRAYVDGQRRSRSRSARS